MEHTLSYEIDMRQDDFDGYVEGFGKSSYEVDIRKDNFDGYVEGFGKSELIPLCYREKCGGFAKHFEYEGAYESAYEQPKKQPRQIQGII